MSTEPSVSGWFAEIDAAALNQLGAVVVERVLSDIHAGKLSVKEVADRSGVRCADVAQICRFHKIDVNANKLTH